LGRIRKALAQAALDSATPDLVIFDEFQCYRELLNAGADNPLAQQLLTGKDGAAPPPILLMSATPLMSVFKSYWRVFSFAFAIADS
jgi:hypothetical protein